MAATDNTLPWFVRGSTTKPTKISGNRISTSLTGEKLLCWRSCVYAVHDELLAQPLCSCPAMPSTAPLVYRLLCHLKEGVAALPPLSQAPAMELAPCGASATSQRTMRAASAAAPPRPVKFEGGASIRVFIPASFRCFAIPLTRLLFCPCASWSLARCRRRCRCCSAAAGRGRRVAGLR